MHITDSIRFRLRAVSIHLIISLLILGLVIYIVKYLWYPYPHFKINGGFPGLRILVLVDLFAGPLVTFVLFNKNKKTKERMIDICLIAIIQLSLLGYGLIQIHKRKPVVMTIDYFGIARSATYQEIADQIDSFEQKTKTLDTQTKPPLVFIRKAKTQEEKEAVVAYLFVRGNGLTGAAFLYESTTSPDYIEQLKSASQNSSQSLLKRKPHIKTMISEYEKNNGSNFLYFPFYADEGKAILVLNDDGSFKEFIGVEKVDITDH